MPPIEPVRFLVSFIVLAVCLAWGCGPSEQGAEAEAEIAGLVDGAVEAARTGDARALGELISDDYEDREGRDRRSMELLLRTLLGRYPYLVVVASGLEVQSISRGLATAEMTLNLAGRDGSRPLPAALDADRLRLRLALRRDGKQWRVTRAEWGEAGAAAGGHAN